MKLVFALFVFFVAAALPFKSIAAEPAKKGHATDPAAGKPSDPTMCGANENPENCHQSYGESHGANHGKTATQDGGHAGAQSPAHGGGHDLEARMNSLFPEHKNQVAEYAQRPQLTKLVSPKFLAQVPAAAPVKLEWSETQGTTNYHLQVATDPNFKWLVVNEHNAKGNSFDLAKLEAGKRYFWRVASVKDSNLSTFTKSNFVSSAFDTK